MAAAASRAVGSTVGQAAIPGAGAFGDLPSYITRPASDSAVRTYGLAIRSDPLSRGTKWVGPAVASALNAPTVRTTAGGRLTAVLIAGDRRVAVIDDRAVSVGDVLPDGSRISAIQPDGVWLVEKNGRWRQLPLSRGR